MSEYGKITQVIGPVVDVSFEGEEHISVYDSSPWAERGFCSRCGTHLFYRIKQTKQYMMPVGLRGNLPELVLKREVFIDEKPAFYSFANQTSTMTGAEIFAKYGAKPE